MTDNEQDKKIRTALNSIKEPLNQLEAGLTSLEIARLRALDKLKETTYKGSEPIESVVAREYQASKPFIDKEDQLAAAIEGDVKIALGKQGILPNMQDRHTIGSDVAYEVAGDVSKQIVDKARRAGLIAHYDEVTNPSTPESVAYQKATREEQERQDTHDPKFAGQERAIYAKDSADTQAAIPQALGIAEGMSDMIRQTKPEKMPLDHNEQIVAETLKGLGAEDAAIPSGPGHAQAKTAAATTRIPKRS